jgi:hypothetical protein
MEREKALVLMLLDLSAFAYYQSKGERERRALEAACGLAERYEMPEEKTYRELLARMGKRCKHDCKIN